MKALKNWFERLLEPSPEDHRRAERLTNLPLIAYYWDGSTPIAHGIRDINALGAYLITDQRWYPGTIVLLTMQRTDCAVNDPDRSISLRAKVARIGEDGVGLAFVMSETRDSDDESGSQTKEADEKTLDKFLRHLKASNGQALIEYALVLPLIFLLIVNMVNIGGFMFAWITVANASRAGANYAILGGASVGSLSQATATQVNTLITHDISSLLNRASLLVGICQYNNGTLTTRLGTCGTVRADPEPTNFVVTTIDVTYTYVPFIPAGFQFRNLNVYVTIPPTTIHQQAVMRSIQ